MPPETFPMLTIDYSMLADGKISQNFTRKESTCRCGCGRYSADVELILTLEKLRSDLGDYPVNVRRIFSCLEHQIRPKTEMNERGIYGVGGIETSLHPEGTAADISVKTYSPMQIARYFRTKYPAKYGLGVYEWGVHVDVRAVRADWTG